MAVDPYANCSNYTIPSEQCTLATCCLAQSASFTYIPVFWANLFFLIAFGVMMVPQIWIGVKTRTWSFLTGMMIGCILEVAGYVGRVMLNDNPFSGDAFLLYLICLTIAPVFITAAMYLTMSRLVVLYGEHNSYIKPKLLALSFMTSDTISLILQAAGGAIAYEAENGSDEKQDGVDVMIAGLLLQAVSLGIFLLYGLVFFWRSHKGVMNMQPEKVACRNRPVFKLFLVNMLLAGLLIEARSIYRVLELWGGFSGDLWNDEVDFLILDGILMLASVVCLTISQPGFAFGEQWFAFSTWAKKPRPQQVDDTPARSICGDEKDDRSESE